MTEEHSRTHAEAERRAAPARDTTCCSACRQNVAIVTHECPTRDGQARLSESDQQAMAVLAAYMNPRLARRLYPHAHQRPAADDASDDVEQS